MFRYVSNRLITSVVLALFATLVVFLIASLVPGDPILAMLGDLAASKPEIVAEYRARWGLDLPLWQQYWIFLQRLFHGDLGISISTGRPVLADIAQYAPATIELGTIAFVLSIVDRRAVRHRAARVARQLGRSQRALHLADRRVVAGVLAGVNRASVFYGGAADCAGAGRLDPIDFPRGVHRLFLIDTLLAGTAGRSRPRRASSSCPLSC
jgi:peptide/nickel transport system permease protein